MRSLPDLQTVTLPPDVRKTMQKQMGRAGELRHGAAPASGGGGKCSPDRGQFCSPLVGLEASGPVSELRGCQHAALVPPGSVPAEPPVQICCRQALGPAVAAVPSHTRIRAALLGAGPETPPSKSFPSAWGCKQISVLPVKLWGPWVWGSGFNPTSAWEPCTDFVRTLLVFRSKRCSVEVQQVF
ncbi:hypothetical protein CB1_002578023 [Camelus ferus]|nr:hypothetical protein CB1_002578023 [Camelus ferus]